MRKRYKRKAPYVQTEEFNPKDGLPEGVEESLTLGKFWFRTKSPNPGGGRPLISGREIKAGDVIIYRGAEVRYVLSKEEFNELYEEA